MAFYFLLLCSRIINAPALIFNFSTTVLISIHIFCRSLGSRGRYASRMTASITFHQPQEPKRRSRSHIDTPERHQRGKELARELEVTSVREEKKEPLSNPEDLQHHIESSPRKRL